MAVIRRYECPLHGEVNHVAGGDRKPLHWECGEACEVVEYVPAEQLRGAVGERDRLLDVVRQIAANDPMDLTAQELAEWALDNYQSI